MVTPPAWEAAEAFAAAMREHGITAPEHLVADGRIHRFHIEGDKPHSRNGWFVLYSDALPAGAFGSWKSGLQVTWHWQGNGRLEVNPADELAAATTRKEREGGAAAERERLIAKAHARWRRATPANPNHPYLRSKRVGVHGVRQLGNVLLVPVHRATDSAFRGAQRIYVSGEKRFTRGAEPKGACHAIGEPRGRIVIAEGYATAATIHEATGDCVIVAFNKGNLVPVAEAVRGKQPEITLIIAADNDRATKGNPGLTAATEAARAVNGLLAVPRFQEDDEGTDFNDLEAVCGMGEVTKAILGASKPPEPSAAEGGGSRPPPPTNGAVKLDDFFCYMPDYRFIFVPCRDLWPASSVDKRIPLKNDKASAWLARERPVEVMTWMPGTEMVIEDRLYADGGWVEREGCRTFNLYRPPVKLEGDPEQAEPWIYLVAALFPEEHGHIIPWLAHRVQRPYEKVNHGLVLGGDPGIGKDTVIEGVIPGIGAWNVKEISPQALMRDWNDHVKSVLLRVSESRDLGEVNRYALYEHTKTLLAAPPDTHRVNEKYLRAYTVPNLCGVVFTTNHRDALYLPPDDRRHFVAWSEAPVETWGQTENERRDHWSRIYRWYEKEGGYGHVAAYLRSYDLSGFDPKAPPPKTPAFQMMVALGRAPEDEPLATAIESLGEPPVTTIAEITKKTSAEFETWLTDRRNAKQVSYRMRDVGYVAVPNPSRTDGRWRIGGRNQTVYGRRELPPRERVKAAQRMAVHS